MTWISYILEGLERNRLHFVLSNDCFPQLDKPFLWIDTWGIVQYLWNLGIEMGIRK